MAVGTSCYKRKKEKRTLFKPINYCWNNYENARQQPRQIILSNITLFFGFPCTRYFFARAVLRRTGHRVFSVWQRCVLLGSTKNLLEAI